MLGVRRKQKEAKQERASWREKQIQVNRIKAATC